MEPNAAVAIQKTALRARMLASRRSIPLHLRTEMSMAIAGHVLRLPEMLTAHSVHLYLSMPSHAEVDTASIVEGLSEIGKEISVPVIREGKLISASLNLKWSRWPMNRNWMLFLFLFSVLTKKGTVSDMVKDCTTLFFSVFPDRVGTHAVSVFRSASRWLMSYLSTNGMKLSIALFMNMESFGLLKYL